MAAFDSKKLPAIRDAIAPDGSEVRILLALEQASMAHFALAPGQTSIAVAHRSVAEIWFFLSGQGEMWRCQDKRQEITSIEPGVCLTIPTGTRFQFRALGEQTLAAIAVTLPPWPGEGEAYVVPGNWTPTVCQPPQR